MGDLFGWLPYVIVLAAFLWMVLFRRVAIFDYQRGLLYRNGKFHAILDPGRHTYYRPGSTLQVLDIRQHYVTLPGQEVLTADNIGLRISLAASYRISDPRLAVNQVANYQEALYLILQLGLRDAVGALEVDNLLAQREEIGKAILDRSVNAAAELGLELQSVNMKDIMFPGDLRRVFAQVVSARKEGLAALERARGESAALRNLANAARLLDGNPNLQQLRFLQTLEGRSGSTVVVYGDALAAMVRDSKKPSGQDPD